jgi:hypothetical protein
MAGLLFDLFTKELLDAQEPRFSSPLRVAAGLLGIAVLICLYRVSAGVTRIHAASLVMLKVLMCLGCADLLLAVLSMLTSHPDAWRRWRVTHSQFGPTRAFNLRRTLDDNVSTRFRKAEAHLYDSRVSQILSHISQKLTHSQRSVH